MTRKHFELLAEAIADAIVRSNAGTVPWEQARIVDSVTEALKTTNLSFDPDRFRAACYTTSPSKRAKLGDHR